MKGLLVRVVGISIFMAALVEAGALFFGRSPQVLLSIPVGAAVAVASFLVLAWVVFHSAEGAVGRRGRTSVAAVAIVGCIKLALVGALLWWLISRAMIEPLAFLTGFSTMVVSLLIEGFRSHHRTVARSHG